MNPRIEATGSDVRELGESELDIVSGGENKDWALDFGLFKLACVWEKDKPNFYVCSNNPSWGCQPLK